LLVLGAKALTELNIEKALNFFTRSKDLNPENPKAHLALGRLWFMVSQSEKAAEYFRKAIELDSKSDKAYFQLGLILRSEGKLRHAERMFLKALNFHPNNPNVHNNLGVTLLEQQKFRQAIKYLKQALESYPEHNNARYNLAMSLWGLGKIPEAVEQYKQILEMKPNWATAANSLAWILATGRNEDIRNGKEAIRWAMVACKGEGRKNPEYLDTLAAAYAEAGRFEQAVRTAKKSIELARSARDENLAQEVEHRLGLYRSNKAFHE
jgi:tetratricopeptide (TPR) repeat protein